MPNRLANCSSPYLRQHQNNPVDWFPWSKEAFDRAREHDKPIFLSVGYSACHWCHVMEHESFENDELAAMLNQHFVSIKVDREERPDVDQIYMQAVQMLTGSGGWPMSIFMSPDGKPFFGGTYWPPDSRWGRPGFGQVLMAVVDAWQNKRGELAEQAEQICGHLQQSCRGPEQTETPPSLQWIHSADNWLVEHHDAEHGGFGGAPKFPHAMDLSLLIELSADDPRESRTHVVRHTLDRMARGGIYDHLGGGFARYSVDERWLVPHFEKMLYDNALLVEAYADAYRLWREEVHARVVRETLDYVVREMTDAQGGFYSSEDADSEGVEGKFYVWSQAEVEEVLGTCAPQFCECYGVSPAGNFEGCNILHLPKPIVEFARSQGLDPVQLHAQLEQDCRQLFLRRSQRVRPGLDDKVLLSWNGLMITAMTRGYRALGDERYLQTARAAVDFIQQQMRREDGRLWHTWRNGQASLDAYLDDYAYTIHALAELFQVDAHPDYLTLASELASCLLEHFQDPQGGFFFTADDHEQLIARSKDLADSSVPSGNAMAASGLWTLWRLSGRAEFRESAESALLALSGVMAAAPQAAGQALRALLRQLQAGPEYVLIGGDNDQEFQRAQRALLSKFEPCSVCVTLPQPPQPILQELCPLTRERCAVDGQVTLYQCQDFSCQQPSVGLTAVMNVLAPAEC